MSSTYESGLQTRYKIIRAFQRNILYLFIYLAVVVVIVVVVEVAAVVVVIVIVLLLLLLLVAVVVVAVDVFIAYAPRCWRKHILRGVAPLNAEIDGR